MTRETGAVPTRATDGTDPSEPRRTSVPGPPRPPKRSRIGDLSMRVVYRMLAVAVVVVVTVVAVVAALVLSGTSERPGEGRSGQVAAPPAATPSPGSSSPQASPVASPAVLAGEGTVASASPSASPSASSSAAETSTASPSPLSSSSPMSSPTALEEVARDRSAVVAALADHRVPDLPRNKKLARLPGKAHKGKRLLKDRRAGVWLARLGKPWKIFGAAPFSTKQVLPKVKGAPVRAMLVSCPVPIQAQRHAKDTALLAARWTLNHHPKGSRISWFASQPIKKGWLLAYKVKYKVKGKARFSVAAVAVTRGSGPRPAMVFVTVPDTQRAYWRDINTAVSSIRPK
ncbi:MULTISPECIES: hypothetical protein [Streptosporangium]|uniref:Fibronectin attachment protein n=1 Tax=Streptosporangium jomthongense TaxID=1193683 RepID=A0ABV8F015_9ACTN